MSDNPNLSDIVGNAKKMLTRMYEERNTTPRLVSDSEQLRSEIATFVADSLKSVKDDDLVLQILDMELVNKIMMHELPADELIKLRQAIKGGQTNRTSAILDIFRPVAGTPNPLITPPTERGDNKALTSDLSSGERQALNKVALLIDILGKRMEEKKEGE